MAVRNFSSLKIIALLIFTLELLAPLVLASNEEHNESDERSICVSNPNHGKMNLFAALLCEEAGSEEGREGKDKVCTLFSEISFVEFFQRVVQQETACWPKNFYSRVHAGSTLLPFISIFRI